MIRLIILNIFLISGCSSSVDILERYEMIYDGDVRTYHVFEPKELKKNMTLVVGLHGYTGTPDTFIIQVDVLGPVAQMILDLLRKLLIN